MLIASVASAKIASRLFVQSVYYKSNIKITQFYDLDYRIQQCSTTRHTATRTIRDISIARRIIARNTVYISRFEICKSVKYAKTYIGSLTLSARKDKSRKRDLEESRDLDRRITRYAIMMHREQ